MKAAFAYRFLTIVLGLIVATVAATAVSIACLLVSYPIADWLITEGPLWGLVSKVRSPTEMFFRGFTSIFMLCLVPSALVIMWSEWKRTRSMHQYLVYSTIVSLVSVLILSFLVQNVSLEIWRGEFDTEIFAWVAMATFVFGLPASAAAGYAYWFIAGKRAGRLFGSKVEAE